MALSAPNLDLEDCSSTKIVVSEAERGVFADAGVGGTIANGAEIGGMVGERALRDGEEGGVSSFK